MVAGDPVHPANQGRLCSKGSALAATATLAGRLLTPQIGEREVDWDEAIATVADRFSETIARHGPDSVAFYVSGQMLTEDYYVANKLMKGFIGSGNIDTNSRLCMASAVVAHKLAFGADLVPGCYEDLDLADLVVFSGHNAAWTHPVLFRRMEAARTRGQRHIVIDPRRTDTAEVADLHLALKAQTDVRLWNGLLADLITRGALDRAFIARSVNGFEAVLRELEQVDQSRAAIAADCGLDPGDLAQFFEAFAATPRTVSLFSMGANQSVQGVAKGNAIINAHLATGRIGKPGACPFSITGQPNAMGGRETGGMANTLAAHMDFSAPELDRLSRYWGTGRLARKPGLKAVDMFEAVHEGRIKAIWIMATNPAVSMPDAGRVREALARCPFVVVSDCMATTDTTAFAHVKLPALAWGEKDGTVTNSERCISRQRALFPAPGLARADWEIVAEVARAMGHGGAFGWATPGEVFREWAGLTGFENQAGTAGERVLDLSGLSQISGEDYEQMKPVQWPVAEDRQGTTRLFADGRFATADGRANMVSVEALGPANPCTPDFPLALNTGRIRDQWHTLTRTGLDPSLWTHAPQAYVDVHPDDAAAAGIVEGALSEITTPTGAAVVVAHISEAQRPGSLFMPMHWTRVFASKGGSNGLIASRVDPLSGQPEFKHSPARLAAYGETWRGFLLSRAALPPPLADDIVWRRIPQIDCELYEFAGREARSGRGEIEALANQTSGEVLTYADPLTGAKRRAIVANGRLAQVLYLTDSGPLPRRDWLVGLFAAEALSDEARVALLLGRPLGPVVDPGPMVCSCLRVGARVIDRAIEAGASSVEAVGTVTGAGTNCGSCRPQIARQLAMQTPTKEIAHAL